MSWPTDYSLDGTLDSGSDLHRADDSDSHRRELKSVNEGLPGRPSRSTSLLSSATEPNDECIAPRHLETSNEHIKTQASEPESDNPSNRIQPSTLHSSSYTHLPQESVDIGEKKSNTSTVKHTTKLDGFGSWWWWEIIAAVVMIAGMAALLVIFAAYDGHTLPNWPRGITLNSLTSIFTALIKAMMALVVAEGINQLKWIWFKRPHLLRDLDLFDSASRSSWGSLLLLVHHRLVSFTSIGALAMLLSILLSPMVQQSIQYRNCQIPFLVANGSIPRTNIYRTSSITIAKVSNPNHAAYELLSLLDSGTKAVLHYGILDPRGNNSRISPSCDTGNCTFDAPYQTIGVCSNCKNAAYNLKSNCSEQKAPPGENLATSHVPLCSTALNSNQYNLSLYQPENLRLPFPTNIVMQSHSVASLSTTFLNLSVLQYSAGACTADWMNNAEHRNPATDCLAVPQAYNKIWPKGYGNSFHGLMSNMVAAECVLSWCVKAFSPTNITNSQFIETSMPNNNYYYEVDSPEATWYLNHDSPSNVVHSDLHIIPEPCWIDGKSYSLNNLVNASERIPGRLGTVTAVLDGRKAAIDSRCDFSISSGLRNAIAQYLGQSFLSGHGTIAVESPIGIIRGTVDGPVNFSNDFIEPLYFTGKATFRDINEHMSLFARALTNKMRQTPLALNTSFLDDSNGGLYTHIPLSKLSYFVPDVNKPAEGIMYSNETCIRIVWGWLSILIVLPILTTVFLVMAILRTLVARVGDDEHRGRYELWKSSQYPLLFHNVSEQQAVERLAQTSTLQDMNAEANTIRARLWKTSRGWEFINER